MRPILLALSIIGGLVAADPTTTITIHINPSQQLPNPNTLAPSTHGTLSARGASLTAPLSTANTLVFRNVSAGSYLLDVHCPSHAFAPARVDVFAPFDEAETPGKLSVAAWETYRGNDWDNKGEALPRFEGNGFEARALGAKMYFAERSSFSVMGIFKNPMILLGLVSMGLFIGLPKMVENSEFRG
jgi:ER membrane protein complex subunit 7